MSLHRSGDLSSLEKGDSNANHSGLDEKEKLIGSSSNSSGSGMQIAGSSQTGNGVWGEFAKLSFCFVGLQVSYILWGVTQEQLMTQTYNNGKRFKSASFCVFGNRFLALILALCIVLFRKNYVQKSKTSISDDGKVKGAPGPWYCYAPSSISNSLSSWAQYEALKYVSFPTQVLSKSCKLIPVMLVGIVLNKKSYPWVEYLDAVMITAGVTMFTLSEKSGSSVDAREDSFFGVSLLALYLVCDSFTSQWQSRIYKSYAIDQYQMMLGVNVWSILFTGFTLLQSGEGLESLVFLLSDSSAMTHMILLSISSACGQLFIFYTIKEFGPVVFTLIMTTRSIFSLVISFIMFSHSMKALGILSCVIVFALLFNRIKRGQNKELGGKERFFGFRIS